MKRQYALSTLALIACLVGCTSTFKPHLDAKNCEIDGPMTFTCPWQVVEKTTTVADNATPPPQAYWVPLMAPDGRVYEFEIHANDAPGMRVIVCIPVSQYQFNCLAQRDKDKAYGFLTIQVEPSANEKV